MFARKTAAQPQRKPQRQVWFPSTNTPEGAAEASKQAAYAYFALAFGYLLADTLIVVFRFNPLKLETGPATLIVNAVIAGIAIFVGCMALKKPGLIKAAVVLLWAVAEFVLKVEMLKSANVGMYWINICMTLWAINGLRGAVALRGQSRQAETAAA